MDQIWVALKSKSHGDVVAVDGIKATSSGRVRVGLNSDKQV